MAHFEIKTAGDMMVTAIYFWQIILIIMSLEVVVCEVQCYINVYYYFLLPSNLQFPCQSVTHVWTFLYTSQSRFFFHRKKKSSPHCLTIFSDKRHYREIIDCAGELQMLQQHQGHLTLSNVGYSVIRVLCSEILLFQNGLTAAQRGCSEFEKAVFWEKCCPEAKPMLTVVML